MWAPMLPVGAALDATGVPGYIAAPVACEARSYKSLLTEDESGKRHDGCT